MNSKPVSEFSEESDRASSPNNVHLLLSRLSSEIGEFSGKDGDNVPFERSLNLLKLISEIYRDDTVSSSERYQDLVRLEEGVVALMWEIRPRIPESAPELWRDRINKSENPYAFAHRVYAHCIHIITKNEIEKLDKSLATRLLEYDRKHGKFHDLYIKTKKEYEENSLNLASWDLIVSKVSPEVRNLMRLYSTKKSRSAK